MTASPTDWRLQGQEKFLQGVSLFHRPYQVYRPGWDHDHCEFCSCKFSLDIADALKVGYATADNYHWICEPCFEDFKERFQWRVVDDKCAATTDKVTRKKIDLDAGSWKTPLDFYLALLAAVRAPEWNGTSIQALLDSLVWDGLNEEKPPYTIQVRNICGLSQETRDEIELLRKFLREARAESRALRGYDVDVELEIVS
jgi:hypothetical protein